MLFLKVVSAKAALPEDPSEASLQVEKKTTEEVVESHKLPKEEEKEEKLPKEEEKEHAFSQGNPKPRLLG